MRGLRIPFVLAILVLGSLTLLYKQWLEPFSGLQDHLGKTEVHYDSGPEKEEIINHSEAPEKPSSRLPGFCEYCGPEDFYCKRYGYV